MQPLVSLLTLSRRVSRRQTVASLAAAIASLRVASLRGQESPPIEPIGPESSQEPTVIQPDGQLPPTPAGEEDNIEALPTQEPAPTSIAEEPTAEPTGQAEPSATEEPGTSESPDQTGGTAEYDVSYFAQTGHNLAYPFLDVWTTWGGLDVFGAPLSEPRSIGKNGETQQIFETIVLQFQPAEPEDRRVQGYPLDDRTVTANSSMASRGSGTGFTVSGDLESFWNQHGGELILGAAVTDAFTNNGATVQVFRNAVIERTSDGTIAMRRIGNTFLTNNALEQDASVVPAPPAYGETTLIKSEGGLNLRTGPSADADIEVVLPNNGEFIKVAGSEGEWIPGYIDGYSGWVSGSHLEKATSTTSRQITMENWDLTVWQGRAIGETNKRKEPTTASKEVGTLLDGDPVDVVDWVKGEEVVENSYIWAKLTDGSYVFARNVGRAAPVAPPPLPDDAPWEGKWIDIHLTQQLMTAYENRTPVRTIPVTTGMPGWETPTGWYSILNRVENETMESGAIGADYFYELKNVLYTQYFSDRGHALHYAWWRTPETIGRPGSHGCINMLLEDSVFFWTWADYGTTVYVRTT